MGDGSMSGIIDLRKKRFLRDCKEYLKTGIVSESLRMDIVVSSPGHIEYLKKGLTVDELKLTNIVVDRIKKSYQKTVSANRQKVNIIASSVLENLSTSDKRFEIKEVMERYRESINPVKALYYDLQEIMFLYDGKTKKDHHRFLIEKFNTSESFEEILLAVDKDIHDLHECKLRLKDIREEFSMNHNIEYAKKIIDLYSEMQQWKKLFTVFPTWVVENKSDEHKSWLSSTLNKFFSND